MVCAHCGSESHRTGDSKCEYCTLCKEPGHRQKRAGCKFRVCNKCGISGHSASECTQTGCSDCGSTTHKSAKSFACAEHKCTNCQGTLEPKGHNRNDCPRMETEICDECGETGHSANKCSIVRAMHVVFEVTNYKRAICVQNTCALYVTAKNCRKVTTTIYAHVQSAKRASYSVT